MDLTNEGRRTRRDAVPPSWLGTKKHTSFQRHVRQVKRTIAFLVMLGKSNRTIAKRLGIKRLKPYLDHPEVQRAIEEMEEHLWTRAEKRYAALFFKSLDAIENLLGGKPVKKDYVRPSLRAVELVWTAHGRLPRGRDGEA